jgi:hypothetical protein
VSSLIFASHVAEKYDAAKTSASTAPFGWLHSNARFIVFLRDEMLMCICFQKVDEYPESRRHALSMDKRRSNLPWPM